MFVYAEFCVWEGESVYLYVCWLLLLLLLCVRLCVRLCVCVCVCVLAVYNQFLLTFIYYEVLSCKILFGFLHTKVILLCYVYVPLIMKCVQYHICSKLQYSATMTRNCLMQTSRSCKQVVPDAESV